MGGDTGRHRLREDHDRFLSDLHDRLRNEGDPAVILRETTRRLAEHMGATRTGYGEFDDSTTLFIPRDHWTDEAVVEIAEPIPFAAFGTAIVESHRRGEVWIHESLDEAKLDDLGRETCQQLGIHSAITVPVTKAGKLRSLISVQQNSPRRWSDADVALMKELADRTWALLERVRAEEARAESEQLLATIMQHAPIGIYLKDAQGRFRLANDAVAKLAGQSPDTMIGRSATDLFDPAIAEEMRAADADALAAGIATKRETESGTMELRFPVTTRHGVELAGFQIDISARKRAEVELQRSREALYQAEKISALGSLLAGVSHELNNPLSIIVAQAELLARQAEGTPLADRANKIKLAALRSGRIVQTFLAMARQQAPTRAPVQLNDVVTAALDLAAYGLRSTGIDVDLRLGSDLPMVTADADQLHQVTVNLVINAQQAMQGWSGERRLSISTDRDPISGMVRLEVADSGPGISPDLKRRIFEPFFTTKSEENGTGIGLSFSQGIAEAHGGSLELVDGEGGTRFRLSLPVEASGVGTLPAAANVAPATEQRTALIVDDEVEVAEALGDILSVFGFTAQVADSGAAARAALADGWFDLIVSDLRMPHEDGSALFAWLSTNRPDLVSATAFSTGDTLSAAAAGFLERCNRPFIEKPFTVEDVRRLVEAVFDDRTWPNAAR